MSQDLKKYLIEPGYRATVETLSPAQETKEIYIPWSS